MDTIQEIDLSAVEGPKYRALADAIESAIRARDLGEGTKMPPVRDLAWDMKVTPGTVARAYQWLTDKGLLHARVGSGTFVSPLSIEPSLHEGAMPQPLVVGDGVLDMRSPFLPDVGQVQVIRDALASVMEAHSDQFLQYPELGQTEGLRQAILDNKITSFDTTGLTPDHVVLTHGGQHAISLVLQAVLRGPKPTVLTEELAYPGFRHAVRQVRARAVAVAQDEQGPLPDAIRAACQAHDVQVFCTSAFAHNPTTITTSPERRREIAALAEECDFMIVDDQSYGLVERDRPSYRDLAPDRVWFISSLSKSIAPNLRFGWLVTPNPLAHEGQRVAAHSSFGVSFPIVGVAEHLLRSDLATELRAKVVADNAARVEILKTALEGYELHCAPDVSFAYLKMPSGWRASHFQRRAEEEGVLLRNADSYVLVDGRAPNAVRIAINARASYDAFAHGCRVLRALLDKPPHEIGV